MAPEPARRSVAVLAWDVGHNPLGRAYVLAALLQHRFDVEIWGAQFERYGTRVWAPLRDADIPIHTFPGADLPSFMAVMADVVPRIDADAIWVSKPRMPSLALGMLAKEARNRPLVLDVDDHELAFFDEAVGRAPDGLRRWRHRRDLALPHGRTWTQACETLIGETDAVTVSNVALQERYGGTVVPHARDAAVFDPQLYDREQVRRGLGIAQSDRLLLFGGTPRRHKGVIDLLHAVDRLGDPRYKVALFGTGELDALRSEIGHLRRWVVTLPYQHFHSLAPVVGAADLACVLQDPSHPVSRYQMPAKVSDALGMAVPCLVSQVPPLRPLIDEQVVTVHDETRPLHESIAQIFEEPDEARARALRGRERFLKTYSYAAACEAVAPLFEGLLEEPPPLSPRLRTVLSGPVRRRRGRTAQADPRPGDLALSNERPRTVARDATYDLVVFWKQNDTLIYGRRQDMLVKYLERSGRFHRIVHFDRPVSPESLLAQAARALAQPTDQTRLVLRQTARRLLRRADRGRVRYRTFLVAGRWSRWLGLPDRTSYSRFVRSVLDRQGLGRRPTIFWVYPSNLDFPAIADALEPDLVVADVVDDDHSWHAEGSSHHDRIDENYQRILGRSDVVLANCAPVAQRMERYAPTVHVVPNGWELPDGKVRPCPPELAGLDGPVIGYVGNLSSRLDLDLLASVVSARPKWQFVFVGSTHLDRSALRLDELPNVHLVGTRTYEETLRFVEHFDVGLIPHVDDEMTRSMNPLKAFVYGAAGVPVVSTQVANLAELGDLITVATGPEKFVDAIDEALRRGRRTPDCELLRRHSWEARVEQVLALIDAAATTGPAR